MSTEFVYAVYKGDKFIDIGTKKELAKRMGCKPEFIGFLASPSNLKRIKNDNALLSIRIGTTKDKLN